MSGRRVMPRAAFEPLAILIALVIVELVLLTIGLALLESGWKPTSPAPMVSNVQLPDVPGDGQ